MVRPTEKHANGCSVQGARAVEIAQFLKFIFFFKGQTVEEEKRGK